MIPVNEPAFLGNEQRYVREAMASGWLSSGGPFVERFERDMAEYVGRKYAIAVNSGTAALDLAVAALGIGPGDEVIVPTFTIISCVNEIVRRGATPVLVDCDADTFNIDVRRIEEAITSRTKAIMAVHIYGLPVDMDPLMALAEKHDLLVIEDAAEVHGQTYKGKRCGSFGDVSTFSFYANKIITTGEGGMVLTDEPEIAERVRRLANLGFGPERDYKVAELGWASRMTNLQAAVGCAQLEYIGEILQRKRTIGALYTMGLQGLPLPLQLPIARDLWAQNCYWVYPIVSRRKTGAEMRRDLRALGVDTRPFFWPLHRQEALDGKCAWDECDIAEHIVEYGFYIPAGTAITGDQIDIVIQALKEVA